MFNNTLLCHNFQFQQRAITISKGSTVWTNICPLASKNTSLARQSPQFSNVIYLAVSRCCAKDVLLLLDHTRSAPMFSLTCSVYCVFCDSNDMLNWWEPVTWYSLQLQMPWYCYQTASWFRWQCASVVPWESSIQHHLSCSYMHDYLSAIKIHSMLVSQVHGFQDTIAHLTSKVCCEASCWMYDFFFENLAGALPLN